MTPHPYAGHPAALVLADHQPKYVTAVTQSGARVRCCCDDWDGQWCDFAAHQVEALAAAGLLARGGFRQVTPAEEAEDARLMNQIFGACICSSVVPEEVGYRHALDCPMYCSPAREATP